MMSKFYFWIRNKYKEEKIMICQNFANYLITTNRHSLVSDLFLDKNKGFYI